MSSISQFLLGTHLVSSDITHIKFDCALSEVSLTFLTVPDAIFAL